MYTQKTARREKVPQGARLSLEDSLRRAKTDIENWRRKTKLSVKQKQKPLGPPNKY